jgi:hypothetical protein
MQLFTVYAVYPDTQQRFCETVNAADAYSAENIVRDIAQNDLLVAAVVAGSVLPLDVDYAPAAEGNALDLRCGPACPC